VTLTGIARRPEAVSSFTPMPDAAQRLDYVRDVDRLAALTSADLAPFAPVYIDLPAGEPGALPQGGETVLSFPNNHLGYAMTWFGFAIVTPVMLLIWLLRQLRPQASG
jgi:surfeit locus 1 family protein